MTLEHLTLEEIAIGNNLANEFSKSIKNTSPFLSPTPVIAVPNVAAEVPIEVPVAPVSNASPPIPPNPNADNKFPWGYVIVSGAVLIGGYLLYQRHKKNKEEEEKDKADRKHQRTLQNRKYLAELERNPETLTPNPMTIEDYMDENF